MLVMYSLTFMRDAFARRSMHNNLSPVNTGGGATPILTLASPSHTKKGVFSSPLRPKRHHHQPTTHY